MFLILLTQILSSLSESVDSDSVELMNIMATLTTPIFNFHWVSSNLATLTMIPGMTPSLVKTDLLR